MAAASRMFTHHPAHPEHTLEIQASASGYVCDLCRGSDGQRWKCASGCNWDACGRCCDAVGAVRRLPTEYLVPFHAHTLVFTDSSGYSCDKCRSSDSRRYRCSAGCDVDMCGRCFDGEMLGAGVWPAAGAPPPMLTVGMVPAHPHTLKLQAGGGFRCDGCGGGDSDRRYRCSTGCDYDYCGSCFDSLVTAAMAAPETAAQPSTTRSEGKVPMHPHTLKLQSGGGFRCDGCGGGDPAKRFRCAEGCDYDFCGTCFATNVVDEQAVADAAAGGGAAHPVLSEGSVPAHPHTLKLQAGGGFRCDGCGGGDSDRRYRCSTGCDYDYCGSCFDSLVTATVDAGMPAGASGPARAAGTVSDHPHVLVLQSGGGFACDLCRNGDPDRRYHCQEGCDFDVCGDCMDRVGADAAPASAAAAATVVAGGPVAVAPPPAPAAARNNSSGAVPQGGTVGDHEHPLKLLPGGGFACDLCHNGDMDRRYQCTECGSGFDVCGDCFDAKVSPGGPAEDLDHEDGTWVGELIPVRCLSVAFRPGRRGPTSGARVLTAVDKKQYGVLEYGIEWHVSRFKGKIERLVEGVPAADGDYEFERVLGRDGTDELLDEIADACSRLYSWLRQFIAEHGMHEAVRPTVALVDGALCEWLDKGLVLRNKVAVMRLRDLHGRPRMGDDEPSPLEFGLDYALNHLRHRLSEGVPPRADADDAYRLFQEVLRELDDLREWHKLFKAQVGYLREAQETLREVEAFLPTMKPLHDALVARAGEELSPAERNAGGPDLTGFVDSATSAADAGAGEGDGAAAGAGAGAAASGRVPPGPSRVPAEVFPELPPPLVLSPLNFTVGHTRKYLKALRRANALANDANNMGFRTARFFRTFPVDDPAAFKHKITRSASADGGWNWERFFNGDGITGCKQMQETLAKAKEAAEELQAAADDERDDLHRRREERHKVEVALAPPGAAGGAESKGMEDEIAPKASADGAAAASAGAGAATAASASAGAAAKDLHPELTALQASITAAEAAMAGTFAGWETAWKNALSATAADGAVKRVQAAMAEADKWKEHAYGPGAQIGGSREPHERAYKATAALARKTLDALRRKIDDGSIKGARASEWATALERIAGEADAAHVALCLKWGVESAHYERGEGPDNRYYAALAEQPEAQASLKEAQAAAKAAWEAKRAEEERLRREEEERRRKARADKAAALASASAAYTGGTLAAGAGGADAWTYTRAADGTGELTCTAGAYAGSRHTWVPRDDQADGAMCLFGDPKHGQGMWDGAKVWWTSPVGYYSSAPCAYAAPASGAAAAGPWEAAPYSRRMASAGMPHAWLIEGTPSAGDYRAVPRNNAAPSLIGTVTVTGSVPPEAALLVAMFGASVASVRVEGEALEAARAAERERMAALTRPTGTGGGSRVPPPGMLHGKIQLVTSWPDVTCEVVGAFADIDVQVKDNWADREGEWQLVDSFPDWKVQIVSAFGDYKIRYVDAFPGVKR